MELMKHSHPGYTFESEEELQKFEADFANVSIYVPGLKNSRPMNMGETQVGYLPFCAVGSLLGLSQTSVKIPKACDLFQPIVTTRGLCYSFNSETMPEIFSRSVIPESWFKVFRLRETSNLIKPSGYGPSNGLNFALNTYQAFADFRINKYSIIHISNENNPHDIFKQSYLIEPGFTYTFRIVANQVMPQLIS